MALSLPSRSPRSTDMSPDCSLLTRKRARTSSLDSSDTVLRARKRSSNDENDETLLTSDIDLEQDFKMEGPYKPDDEERDEYYFGLAGKPTLVARTSHDRWSRPERTGAWTGQIRKRFAAVLKYNQPEIVARWTKDLVLALIQGLGDCRWTYFFPIRIGLEDTRSSELPTILLVAVERDSLQWEEGVAIALECRRILQEFKIANVEVEIREGEYTPSAASTEFESQINTTAWTTRQYRTNELALPMLSSSGYSIGYAEERLGDGSIGLHLKLGDNSAIYGLTCRHVVSNRREPHESYKVSEEHNQQNKQYHVQGNKKGFQHCLDKLEAHQEELDERIEPLQTKITEWEWKQHVPEKAHLRPRPNEISHLADLQSRAAYNQQVIDLLDTISKKEDRQIGHLAFHPKLEMSSEQPGYLTDWALIELDTNKFSSALDNKVFLGRNSHVSEELLDKGFLPLYLQDPDPGYNKPVHVAKRGYKTGLTFGQMNSIEAVVRRQTGSSYFAWELLIVSTEGNFSEKGDSGSIIFDMSGAVIGMVNGSTDGPPEEWRGIPVRKKYPGGTVRPEDAKESLDTVTWPKKTDVTFATPIQWVLEDIERFTGLEPRLV